MLTTNHRFAYRRVFTADGNYKADHVRQTGKTPDVWLGEGGGMAPLRTEYKYFLEHAKERRTVSVISMPMAVPRPF